MAGLSWRVTPAALGMSLGRQPVQVAVNVVRHVKSPLLASRGCEPPEKTDSGGSHPGSPPPVAHAPGSPTLNTPCSYLPRTADARRGQNGGRSRGTVASAAPLSPATGHPDAA